VVTFSGNFRLGFCKWLVDKLERAKGFEPSAQDSQHVVVQCILEHAESNHTQIRAQMLDNDGRDLAQVVKAWAGLSSAFKAAILAIVNSAHRCGEDS
jgi:predicted small metal-binding protein